MNMRLLGARNIGDVCPDMIDASNIGAHVAAIPGDRLYDSNCEFDVFFDQPEHQQIPE
jgi:L-lactate dehydrogenase (cytochrome)